jgi:hypothetical protein
MPAASAASPTIVRGSSSSAANSTLAPSCPYPPPTRFREEPFFAAYNKITSTKDLVIYPDFAHEPLPGEPERTFNFMLGL